MMYVSSKLSGNQLGSLTVCPRKRITPAGLSWLFIQSWKAGKGPNALTWVSTCSLLPVVCDSILRACGLRRGLEYKLRKTRGGAPPTQLPVSNPSTMLYKKAQQTHWFSRVPLLATGTFGVGVEVVVCLPEKKY